MGKENELINAAKNGNVAQIEKLLGQRNKKSSLHNIMGRSVNPNYQDEMGYSPLHYAAMNGHRSAVELLLKYDASTNIPDHSGNYPLHLAAFNGHAEVSRVLINTGPSQANVNEQNGTLDTALHSASQYGYNQVVAVLLENHADPYIRNCRKESALDLAAQYGRIETVKLLLNYHPNLLQNLVKTHTPLHLAARNGHISIVSNLLGCGMAVNTQCDSGTALHEAALFGKLDVCNLLLQCDVDISVKDKNQQTVMDLLMSHPSAKAKEISVLIYEHSQRKTRSLSSASSMSSIETSEKGNSLPQRACTMQSRKSQSYYDDIPSSQRPISGFRRCDTYDSVPGNRAASLPHQQSTYDYVPAHSPPGFRSGSQGSQANTSQAVTPQAITRPDQSPAYAAVTEMTTVIPHDGADYLKTTQTSYDVVPGTPQPPGDSKPVLKPSTVEGYALVMAADPNAADSDAFLSAQNVKDGYTMLGIPCVSKPPPKPQAYQPKKPPQSAIPEEYSTVRHEAEEASRDQSRHGPRDVENSAYFQVETSQAKPNPRTVSHPPVYEVPPLPSSTADGDYGLVGAAAFPGASTAHATSTTSYLGASSSPPVYQSGTTSPHITSADVGGGTYDYVPPPRPTPPMNTPTYEIPPPFKSRPEEASTGTYGFVERSKEPTPNKPCPLDIPQYEVVSLRGAGQMTPDMEPTASLPGYELMGPGSASSTTKQFGDYEVLAFPKDLDYMNVKPENMPVAEQAHPIPTPPKTRPSVYEIAPRPVPFEPSAFSDVQRPSVYEIAPPPRPRLPAREPVAEGGQEGRPISGEGPRHGSLIKEEPPRPPKKTRPMNEYQESPLKPQGSGKQGLPAPYEQVRVEAPLGKMNLDQLHQVSVETRGGEYCTLDPSAIGMSHPPPIPARDDIKKGPVTRGDSVGQVPDTPGIPPPSPTTAEEAVFEAFTSNGSESSAVKASSQIEGVSHRAPPVNHPTPAPRRESLNTRRDEMSDQELRVMAQRTSPVEGVQDPFEVPPKQIVDSEGKSEKRSDKNAFSSLHKQWSPFGSRESLNRGGGEESSGGGGPSALIYENVLFKRADSMSRAGKPPRQEPTPSKPREEKAEKSPGEYRLSALDASSPLDESAEWEKIEAFLSSIGDIEIPTTLDDQIASAGKAKTVAGWLDALGLPQYESDLVSNGFDDLNFFNGGILEDQDLLEIGVLDMSNRKILLEAVKSLPVHPQLVDSSAQSFSSASEWLGSLCLDEYVPRFEHQGYASMERVMLIWEVELTSVLDISALGHRKRMLVSLADLKKQTQNANDNKDGVKTWDLDLEAKLNELTAELSLYCPEEKPAESKPKMPTDSDVMSAMDSGELALAMAEQLLNSEVLKKKTEERKKENRWHHEPEVLLKGSVNYTTQYLGSHMVKEISGVTSTIDACRKMRLSTAKLQKVPSVILSISVNGIKFIDARSRLLVSHHDMKNVSYITQDPEDKCVFAYIAKDAKIDKHYCHVFRVEKKELSDEVTMSIGQAFELAYEQFMHLQRHLNTHAQQKAS
ncbi:ankyrin repeat and sterile alpha motif domain-containing protein 1B isoform X2 [Nematostella vectensis]|uniref:ankyrin repeat and sterile alpha motif domain-containing protein 1B isoform X2 n=1 Tax=Nematostella vectensis TaxID=45351 RepID=UPI0020778694|nr:ankyrin repeat and sterile alpha motif domain-containing protein 1B isoform X2 [Nematostella vectensis]